MQRKQLMRAVVSGAACRLSSTVVTIPTAIVQYVLQYTVVRQSVRGLGTILILHTTTVE